MEVCVDSWGELRKVLEEIFRDAVTVSTGRGAFEDSYPSLFVDALLGRGFSLRSRIERRLVTIIGSKAFEIVKPFFRWWEPVQHPFDAKGALCRGGREIVVKVVSSIRAFNSTTMRAVEEASKNYRRAYILTLHGFWRGEHERVVGNAKWLDGVATWRFLTGDKYAYRRFVRLAYEIGKSVRREFLVKVHQYYSQSRK